MTNTIKDIEFLNKEDTYSVALLLLFIFKDDPKYSTISELSYILDHENFMKFIQYFAGQTVKIPSTDELSKSLKVLMLYQYYVIDELDWKVALHKSGFTDEETYTAQRMLKFFRDKINDYKVGDFINGLKN